MRNAGVANEGPGGDPDEADSPDRKTVTSVIRALRLLECFDSDTPRLSLAELSRRSGLTKSTTHRLLATLEGAGWVERTTGGEHRLTLRAFEVGSTAVDSFDLRTEAGPLLSELAQALGQTAFLTVPDDNRAVCLERVEGQQLVRILALDIGKSLPLTVGGAPMAMLAFNQSDLLPRVLRGDFTRFTDRSLSTEADLRARLDEIVKRGYALSAEDVTEGICAIGAPVLNQSGQAIAALSVAGLSSGYQGESEGEIAAAVIDACARLSERLRYSQQNEEAF